MGQGFQTWRRWTAALAVGALVAAGCGSSGKGASSSTASGSSPTQAASGSGGGAAGGGGSETTGVTASTITIGQIATISGPVPGLFQGAKDALDAFVAYTNANGGVDGRKLKVAFKDDALSCNTYTSAIKSLVPSTFAIVGTFSILDACGAKTLAAYPNFPDLQGYLFDPALYSVRNAMTPSPQPPGYPTTGAVWIKNKFPNDITHSAGLYSLTSKSSWNSISSAYKAVGYKFVYSRGLGTTETNFTSDILRMKAEGIKIVELTSTDVQDIAIFIQEANQQGFHPDAIIAAPAYDGNFFKLLGSQPASNLYMPMLYPMYLGQDAPTNPELATFLKWLHTTHPGRTADIYGVEAWAAGVLFVQALKAAGGSPTRSALINQVNKVTSFTANGLLPQTNPAGKQDAICMVVAGVDGHQFVRLDPPKTGFECNGTYHHISEAEAAG